MLNTAIKLSAVEIETLIRKRIFPEVFLVLLASLLFLIYGFLIQSISRIEEDGFNHNPVSVRMSDLININQLEQVLLNAINGIIRIDTNLINNEFSLCLVSGLLLNILSSYIFYAFFIKYEKLNGFRHKALLSSAAPLFLFYLFSPNFFGMPTTYLVFFIYLPSYYHGLLIYLKSIDSPHIPNAISKQHNLRNILEHKVFIPSLMHTASVVQIGILLGIGFNDPSSVTVPWYYTTNVLFTSIVMTTSQILSIFLIFFRRKNHIYSHILVPLVIIIIGVALSSILELEVGRYIFALHSFSYTMTLLETLRYTNTMRLATSSSESKLTPKKKAKKQDRIKNVMIPALGWGISWISVTNIYFVVVIPNINYLLLFFVNLAFLLYWQNTRDDKKLSSQGKIIFSQFTFILLSIISCTSILKFGFLNDLLVTESDYVTKLLSSADGNLRQNSKIFSWVGTITAMFSILSLSITIIRFAKDIVGLDLKSMFYYIRDPYAYKNYVTQFMFTMVCCCAFCIITTVSWMITVLFRETDERAMTILMYGSTLASFLSALVSIAVFSATFLSNKKLKDIIQDADRLNKRLAETMKKKNQNVSVAEESLVLSHTIHIDKHIHQVRVYETPQTSSARSTMT